jgi:hypothetical protein
MSALLHGCVPFWEAALLIIVIGAFAYLRGWCDGKGIGR